VDYLKRKNMEERRIGQENILFIVPLIRILWGYNSMVRHDPDVIGYFREILFKPGDNGRIGFC
jgi:hypothetical protein